MQWQIPKGLYDILPYGTDEEWRLSSHWQYVESILRQIAKDYGFKEIRTPILERTELFCRGVGESSDIVCKEMYTFTDKSNRSLSLRPEGTAAVMRAFLERNLVSYGSVHKLYYIGPMFRYERPQSGRYRQHHQFGVECVGISSYEEDAELIDLLCELYRRLGLKHFSVLINSLGDAESKENYRKALMEYLRPHVPLLSKESQDRFVKNPLRILDSKDPQDEPIISQAPSVLNYLSPSAKEHFEGVLRLLDQLHIPYKIHDKLVRGLDYYSKTVFEVVSQKSGAQNSLGGGGRYDTLLSNFGGPDLPGVGFGTGIERILQTMLEEKVAFPPPDVPFIYFVPLDDPAREFCFLQVSRFRHLSIPAEIDLQAKKIQKALQNANKIGARYCAIIGEEERQAKVIQVKNMQTGEQLTLPMEHFESQIKEYWAKENPPQV